MSADKKSVIDVGLWDFPGFPVEAVADFAGGERDRRLDVGLDFARFRFYLDVEVGGPGVEERLDATEQGVPELLRVDGVELGVEFVEHGEDVLEMLEGFPRVIRFVVVLPLYLVDPLAVL